MLACVDVILDTGYVYLLPLSLRCYKMSLFDAVMLGIIGLVTLGVQLRPAEKILEACYSASSFKERAYCCLIRYFSMALPFNWL